MTDVSVDGYSEVYLKIRRPTDEDGNVLVSDLDKEVQELLHVDERGGGNWFRLPELLETECVAKSTEPEKSAPGVVVTTYSVPGVSWMVPNEDERRKLLQRREAKLSLVCREGGRTLCTLRDTPLDKITESTLLDRRARLIPSAGTTGNQVPAKAKVLQDDARNCWVAPTGDSEHVPDAYLEVDLGASCRVTWVSTQGRFPPILKTLDTGVRVVRETSQEFMNWVTSYELSCRAASGKQWIALGEFRGNADMTAEVAHELGEVVKQPVECRYLRFRPLTYHGLPAMRVGVYGVRLDAPAKEEEPSTDENLIQYTIYRIKEATNTRWAPLGCGRCRFGCNRCKRTGPCKAWKGAEQAKRKRLCQGFLEELCRVDRDQEAPDWSLREEDGGTGDLADDSSPAAASDDAPAATATPPPRPLALARQQSFSDPDLLSVAETHSTGDSYLQVDGPDGGTVIDDDDWLAV